MLPQHGGVPNFSMRIKGPILALLILILFFGTMIALMFHLEAQSGDFHAEIKVRQTLMVTLVASAFILLGATCRWWHPHLWKHGNSQTHHRKRTKGRRDASRKNDPAQRRRKKNANRRRHHR
jgi:hypothetical protein